MAKRWSSHGPSNCFSWIIINVPGDTPCQISQFWVYPMVPFPCKWPKYGPFMAKTWSSYGSVNWFFLNHNQCAQGCSMPYFTNLGVSHSPLFLENMAITCTSHGPSNRFFLNHNQCAQECSMPNFTNLGVSHCPLFLEMAKIWPFYGQNMVLTWSVKLVLPES